MDLKIPLTLFTAFVMRGADAFVPHSSILRTGTTAPQPAVASKSARFFGVDPNLFHDVAQHTQHLPDIFSSFSLADAVDAADTAGDVANEVVKDNGWFGFLTEPIELLLQLIHSGLSAVGISENSWGVSIIAMTLVIKALTFPLTKTQLESTNKMQALQPVIKETQAKYQSNPEVMNQKIAELYQQNQVNPLAGCLPSLVQIPVFIGLYRAVLDLAKENKLDESFLFLPNLEGPTYGADPAHGSDWLFQGWTDAGPPLGWPDTIAFLALPILLIISQFASVQLMQPSDPSQRQDNIVLKILPLMIGWFSLNVPAALCVYWFTNNIITTATTLFIRNNMDMSPVSAGGSGSTPTSSSSSTDSTIFAPPPMREKPAGFGSSSRSSSRVDSDGVKPITADIQDAEIESVVPDDHDDDESEEEPSFGEGTETAESKPRKKRGKSKKKN